MLGVVACACNLATFLSAFSFSDIDNTQDSRGRKGAILYSTLQLPPAHEHWNIYLDVTWLSHIFNRTACIYQTATQWDLPPYRITISLIHDVILICCFFTLWFDYRFLLQQFGTRNSWTRTHIGKCPCITSEPINQVC